jgi:hypothetical protein
MKIPHRIPLLFTICVNEKEEKIYTKEKIHYHEKSKKFDFFLQSERKMTCCL